LASSPADKVCNVLTNFAEWLGAYGKTPWDYQSFFAGSVGGPAKAVYYHHRLVETSAATPMILCEAFLPSARRLFHHRMRFRIADAQYAMDVALLGDATGNSNYLERAIQFLNALTGSRCRDFKSITGDIL
jgi:hypothetical protein